nr:pancreatic lipase-related protein 2-like [Nomia melanderi]
MAPFAFRRCVSSIYGENDYKDFEDFEDIDRIKPLGLLLLVKVDLWHVGTRYAKLIDFNYLISVIKVNNISEASTFNKLYNAGVNQPKCMHLIGHSLSGQLVARVGEHLVFPAYKITGLDFADPLFLRDHLNVKDALFVDVIHTDAEDYGQIFDSGSVNFKPNFGRRIQPSCPIVNIPFSDNAFCSHHRYWMFWAESLQNEIGFLAVKCSDSVKFALGLCDSKDIIPMGSCYTPECNRCLLVRTNAESPYTIAIYGTERILVTLR